MSKKREVRVFEFRKQELRTEEQDGKRYIVGIIPYYQLSEDLGGFKEILSAGCFSKTIKENRIYALINHNSDKCLGNSKSGTLILIDTETYLECRIEINEKVTFARDLFECVARGDVVGLSFGFSAIKENWDNTTNVREIKEAKLYEISFGVVFPAYQTTTSFVEARSILTSLDNLSENERKIVIDTIKEKYPEDFKSETEQIENTDNTQNNNTTQTTASQDSTQSERFSDIDLYYYRAKLLNLNN